MSNFIPGKLVENFVSKSGISIEIRYPRWEDLDSLLAYINTISKEDTFLTLSGEQFTREQEANVLAGFLTRNEMKNCVILFAVSDNKVIGVCNLDRDLQGKRRTYHSGNFGLSIAKDFRGEGIGFVLSKNVIREAKENIENLKIVELNVCGENFNAQKLYSKLGFIEAGRIKDGYFFHGNYQDKVIMTLSM